MTDLVQFEPGANPWAPSQSAELIEVFHRFTIPLVGIFRQDGNQFLFWCVVGHAGPDQAWAYARVSDDEASRLREASDDEFDEVLQELAAGQVLAFAMASDDEGIRIGVDIDPPSSFYDVYQHGMNCIQRRIEKAAEEFRALNEAFPRMQPPNVAPSIGSHTELLETGSL